MNVSERLLKGTDGPENIGQCRCELLCMVSVSCCFDKIWWEKQFIKRGSILKIISFSFAIPCICKMF